MEAVEIVDQRQILDDVGPLIAEADGVGVSTTSTNEHYQNGIMTPTSTEEATSTIQQIPTQQNEPSIAPEKADARRQDTSLAADEVVDPSNQKDVMLVEGAAATRASTADPQRHQSHCSNPEYRMLVWSSRNASTS